MLGKKKEKKKTEKKEMGLLCRIGAPPSPDPPTLEWASFLYRHIITLQNSIQYIQCVACCTAGKPTQPLIVCVMPIATERQSQ